MEYVTDDQGQIKVMDEKGNHKFLHKNLVDNHRLMTRMGFTPVQKPMILEPERPKTENTKSNVADVAPAKGGKQ